MTQWQALHKATKALILQNPTPVTWARIPLVDNGRGTMIPAAGAEAQSNQAVVRISHQSGGVPQSAVKETGLTTNKSAYALFMPEIDLRKDDVITAQAAGLEIERWKLLDVTRYSANHGGVSRVYKQEAALQRADG